MKVGGARPTDPDRQLLAASPEGWIAGVLTHFDSFLLDHASAERKAAAMATSFVVQYPDRFALHIPLIRMAREELLHYQQVMRLVHRRNLIWQRDEKDPYVQILLAQLSTDREKRLLDRLLMGAVIEARGVERFGLVARLVEDATLQRFYARLAASEANHTQLFTRLARHYFSEDQIDAGLDRWLRLEAEAIRAVPLRSALH